MRIGIIGAGRIGGNAGRLFEQAGHEVFLGSRDTVGEAAAFADVVMLSVPWRAIDDVLAKTGPLAGKVVIDTTNPFGAGGVEDLGGRSAGRHNAERMPGARIVRAFNTLTAGFQGESAGRAGDERVVLFLSGDDADAKALVSGLIEEIGFAPCDVGGLDEKVADAPRRPGAVYGEEYRAPDAAAVVDAVRSGGAVPPPRTPSA
jgi:8-hydroxy-5-deazaflavin:NADPH oxidoreductase